MACRRVVLQTRPISSVPPGLPFYKSRPLRTRSESTLPQLLIPLHFNFSRINIYKKTGEGVPSSSPKVLQLVTHNSRPTQDPHPRHEVLATHHSSPATIPFRITSFADPHLLTPIESHLYKKQGRGGVSVTYERRPARNCMLLESIRAGPQTQTRVLDEINLFSRHSIPALLQLYWIVELLHVVEFPVSEARPFHVFASQISRTPGDVEPSFG
jgi:hypothetical protein